MKFLIEWITEPEDRQTLIKILREKYEQPEEVKTVFPIHNCVGSGNGFAVVETDSVEAIQKMLEPFLDLISYDVTPIIPVKVK
ncbi:MAG: DUF3303 domain-containing protein [Candidatus Thorarchaeota archaeon]